LERLGIEGGVGYRRRPAGKVIEWIGMNVGSGGPNVKEVSEWGGKERIRLEFGEDAMDFEEFEDWNRFLFCQRGFEGGKGI
jgi:hypothetical protein